MKKEKRHPVETLFMLLIFCIFTVSSLFVILIGANAYRGVVDGMGSNNDMRASLSYVANKVRGADPGTVDLIKLEGRPVLVIRSTFESGDFNTYIFEEGGSLRELFTSVSTVFNPKGGDTITSVSDFSMKLEDGLLTLSASGGKGRSAQLRIALASEKGGNG